MQKGPQWFFHFCFHNMYQNPHFIESRWQTPPWMCKRRRRAGMLLICLPSGQQGTGGGWDRQCSVDECRKQGWNIESGWLGGRYTNSGHQGIIREGREKEKGGKASGRDIPRILQSSHSCALSLTGSDSQGSVCIRQLPLHRKLLLSLSHRDPGLTLYSSASL